MRLMSVFVRYLQRLCHDVRKYQLLSYDTD
jgi:hypothetical protein